MRNKTWWDYGVGAQLANEDFLGAARYIAMDQRDPKKRVNVWRKWKRFCGKRSDYNERTKSLVNAMFVEYETGGALFREIIANIFDMPKGAGKLPTDRFLNSVRRNNKFRLPLPDKFVPEVRVSTIKPKPQFRYPKLALKRTNAAVIDLRNDSVQLRKLIVKIIRLRVAYAEKIPQAKPVSAIAASFCLCQAGWISVHFDERSIHQRDGDCTSYLSFERIKAAQWKKDHDLLQKRGGALKLPNGKRVEISPGVSCNRLARIYGNVVKSAIFESKKAGHFKGLLKAERCQIDIEEFEGMWSWPKFKDLGKNNFV